MGVLLEAGTYAAEPDPVRPWPPDWEGGFATAPGDVRGVTCLLDRCDGYCCGMNGRDGPNLACVNCGQPVGSRVDDCAEWQVVWLYGRAVRRGEGAEAPVLGWPALRTDWPGVPPLDQCGWWDPRGETAVAAALARLLIASAGAPIRVPDGPLADFFRRLLDKLGAGGSEPLTLRLAGPGRPAPVRAGEDRAAVILRGRSGRVSANFPNF